VSRSVDRGYIGGVSAGLDERGVVVACPSCGRQNRVPFTAAEARCGGCRTTLPPPDAPMDVPTSDAFDALVSHSARPVLVDFWAPWCGPCRMVAPEMARVAATNAGRWLVVKVNTDALPDLGERFAIRSIPTMAVFRNGKEVARTAGARPAADIETFVRNATS
jgi:thioredoxin 2